MRNKTTKNVQKLSKLLQTKTSIDYLWPKNARLFDGREDGSGGEAQKHPQDDDHLLLQSPRSVKAPVKPGLLGSNWKLEDNFN